MSAIIVLILRILLVACLYIFLAVSFVILWRELIKTIELQKSRAYPRLDFDLNNGAIMTFSQPEITIGRGLDNDILLEDETVSLNHARIYLLNKSWMIEDSQSTNGTFLNDEILHLAVILVDQDLIKVGEKIIRVIFPDNKSNR